MNRLPVGRPLASRQCRANSIAVSTASELDVDEEGALDTLGRVGAISALDDERAGLGMSVQLRERVQRVAPVALDRRGETGTGHALRSRMLW